MAQKRRIIFLEDLKTQSVREACLGAAEYAAEQPDWHFDPWPVTANQSQNPSAEDLKLVDGILTTEPAMKRVYGIRHRTRIPRVYLLADVHHPGVPYVSLDEWSIGRMAAEHLSSRGYRHFAFIGVASFGWSQHRGRGFSQALGKNGAPVRNHSFREESLPVFWSWNMARRNQDLDRALAEMPKPVGILAANDVIACFVLQTARQKGYRVPEDIGVVGVDDDPLPNAASGLTISSIHPPFREVGWQAARMLDLLLGRKKVPEYIRIPPLRVVVRASTDGFMTPDLLVRRAQQFIEAHRHKKLTVGEVTRAVGTNRVTLGKKFQRELDVGLLEYILKRRIEYAKERLQTGSITVDEISDSSGFSSSSYFSRVFKKITGMTPGLVRKSTRGQA